eukprot:m.197479 g.197479  ORF g.197479 m.197479 type:complete len:59 (-) comp15280_c0_seq1:2729-2905(-)
MRAASLKIPRTTLSSPLSVDTPEVNDSSREKLMTLRGRPVSYLSQSKENTIEYQTLSG